MSGPMKVFAVVIVLIVLIASSIFLIKETTKTSKNTITNFDKQATKILGGEATT